MTATIELQEVKALLGLALRKLEQTEKSVKVRSNPAHEAVKKYREKRLKPRK
jgi:hypothetical protein